MSTWVVGVVLCGCGGEDKPVRQVDAAIDAPVGMAMIGPEGGTVASADGIASLTIPPNALTAETMITIDAVQQTMWPAAITAAGTPIGPVYEVGPEGTTFATEATLTWTFATTPAGALGANNKPALLLGHALPATGPIEPHLSGTDSRVVGTGLVVETHLRHLSKQFLFNTYPRREGTAVLHVPIGDVTIELGGGDHAVDAPWYATKLELVSADLNTMNFGIIPKVSGTVANVSAAEWQESFELARGVGGPPPTLTGWTSGPHTLNAGASFAPSPLTRFNCTAAGGGTVAARWFAHVDTLIDIGNVVIEASVEATEAVNCIVRVQKPEYSNETATLGSGRIATAAVPSTQSVNLDGTTAMGLYGYNITLLPGQTIRVCVSSNGSTALNYFPRYPPGYTFVDGNPGCTDITNLDPNNPNEVLLKLSGTGTNVQVTVSAL